MASLALLQRVLAWAAEQGMSVRDQLTEEQIVALERTFRRVAPWSFAQYQPLRFFSHALSRLDLPDLPARLSFGDILDALDELRGATAAAWPTHTTVLDSTLSELGYASTSAGITRIRDANKDTWREHANNNRQFVLRAAERAAGARALVVGAGKLYDIPLRQLAERFEQLLLVDIDAAAMAESVEHVGLEPRLRARLSLFQADVTGITDVFIEKTRAALSLTGEAEVYTALLEVLRGYRVDEPPRLLPESAAAGPLDFVSSSMVLSQLAASLTGYVETQFARRFPASERSQSLEFQVALGQFTHRVQHAHVRSLLAAAPVVALSSDIAEQYVGLDAQGNVRQGAEFKALIGAASLNSLIPRQRARVVLENQWQWRHVVPTRSKPHGRTVLVAGVAVERC
ncbi:MAG TPA: hypothetical protein VIM73_19765 [Polyangiaceae bacterium]